VVCERSFHANSVTIGMFQTRFQVNSGYVCGLSTVDASKLGLLTVGVFKTRFQVNSGSG